MKKGVGISHMKRRAVLVGEGDHQGEPVEYWYQSATFNARRGLPLATVARAVVDGDQVREDHMTVDELRAYALATGARVFVLQMP